MGEDAGSAEASIRSKVLGPPQASSRLLGLTFSLGKRLNGFACAAVGAVPWLLLEVVLPGPALRNIGRRL